MDFDAPGVLDFGIRCARFNVSLLMSPAAGLFDYLLERHRNDGEVRLFPFKLKAK